MAHVLVMQASPQLAAGIELVLQRTNHVALHARDGAEALRRFWNDRPDLVVLDLNLTAPDGWTILSRIRELSDVPVLMTAVAPSSSDRVRGLQAGADDFVALPGHGPELAARVQALLRRIGRTVPGGAPSMSDGWAAVDSLRHEASVAGEPMSLTPIEFRLLCAFLRHPSAALSHEQLLSLVWDGPFGSKDQVKVAVMGLRRKLEATFAGGAAAISTVRGVGYRWDTPQGVRAAA